METSVYDILINDGVAECILSDDGPVVQYWGKRFATLAAFAEAAPALTTPENLHLYCRLSNFFFKGISFDFIEDIQAYQKGYEQRRSHEKMRSPGLLGTGGDFGPFDVSEMHAPKIEGGNLVYFVEDAYYGIPYKVTTPFPASTTKSAATYTLLPG